jgi:hypothetical protein
MLTTVAGNSNDVHNNRKTRAGTTVQPQQKLHNGDRRKNYTNRRGNTQQQHKNQLENQGTPELM